jgi:hypothetical protein
VLAGLGIYAVATAAVAERRAELAIRVALGRVRASRRSRCETVDPMDALKSE